MTMTQLGNQTPTITEVIKEAIRENQLELNTMLPAEIIDYDALTQTCTVQPSLRRTSIDPPKVVSRPEIEDVPVIFPRSGTGGVFFPLEPGDGVMLIFSQRSLDDWIDTGGEVQVRDTRLHDLTDAVALAGFYPTSGAISPPQASDATELRGDKILIGNTGLASQPLVLGTTLQGSLEDLIAAINDLIALITSGETIGTVPTQPNPSAACTSTIATGPVESALAAVEAALPANNSTISFGE